ncbi:N-acetyltransferase family protein [Streptomyces sp. 549]|uniref:GNAT family N-acetyltransferase n=1 Tax=Streptomyces sp. 549 TaxID=3049076 RepID=UPI0024C4333B|nr:N-acetyltransferase family protein [Streptomyces sp. 549]MDK1477042.1 N-acetyltransferase family protein [Streptomyces sp. 549]
MAGGADVQVRAGDEDDLADLTRIYNHYVAETPITFDTRVFTAEERRPWLLSHPVDGPHRLLVARTAGTRDVLGYATSSPMHARPAYLTSVEVSVYTAPGRARAGVGTALYEALFAALEKEDVHRAYASIALPNAASERLHTRFGFRHVGTYHEVGRKFGRFWDVARYEKAIGA